LVWNQSLRLIANHLFLCSVVTIYCSEGASVQEGSKLAEVTPEEK
jgi:hypothetical protein